MEFDIGIAGWIFHRSITKERTMTLLDLPAVCKSLGVRTVELVAEHFEVDIAQRVCKSLGGFDGDMMMTHFASHQAEYLHQLRDAIRENGLRVRNIAVDLGNLANPDEIARRTDLEAQKQWIHVARSIGAESIRVNSGPGEPGDKATLERIASGLSELAALGAQSGVYLVMENHGGAASYPENVEYFLERVNSPWFRTCPDNGGFRESNFEEGMRVFAPHAYTCHVKAFQYDPEGFQVRTWPNGDKSRIDMRKFLSAMLDAGYRGPFNVENGASATDLDCARDGIAYYRELLASL